MNPWLIVGLLVAFGLVGLGAYAEGYGYGKDSQKAVQQKAIDQAVKEKDIAEAKTLRAEQAGAVAIANAANYQERLENVTQQRDTALASVRSGQRLRVDLAAPCSGTVPETAASTIGRDGQARGELSSAASERLVEFAADADRNTEQLEACQAIVIEDRKICQ